MKIKHLIFAWLFLVQWNEWELKPHYDRYPNEGSYIDTTTGFGFNDAVNRPPPHLLFSTVELATHTITLATRQDVQRFLNYDPFDLHLSYGGGGSLIGDKAFNISVKEIK